MTGGDTNKLLCPWCASVVIYTAVVRSLFGLILYGRVIGFCLCGQFHRFSIAWFISRSLHCGQQIFARVLWSIYMLKVFMLVMYFGYFHPPLFAYCNKQLFTPSLFGYYVNSYSSLLLVGKKKYRLLFMAIGDRTSLSLQFLFSPLLPSFASYVIYTHTRFHKYLSPIRTKRAAVGRQRS